MVKILCVEISNLLLGFKFPFRYTTCAVLSKFGQPINRSQKLVKYWIRGRRCLEMIEKSGIATQS